MPANSFEYQGLTFRLDETGAAFPIPAALELADDALDEKLLAGGVLPDLGGAPIASWVIARLSYLAGTPLGSSDIEVCEDAVFVFDFLVSSAEGDNEAKVQVQGGSIGVGLLGLARDPARVTAAFIGALIQSPDSVAPCEVRALDPTWEGSPNRYGWDGGVFLGADNRILRASP